MIRLIFQAADAVVEEVAAEMENRIKEEEVILVCLLVSPVIFFLNRNELVLHHYGSHESHQIVVSPALVFFFLMKMTCLTHVNQVEKAIEIALANPIDFEYAIDKEVRDYILQKMGFPMSMHQCIAFILFYLQGRIFQGRKTLCNLLDKSQVKKLPEPTADEKFILQN